MFAGDAFLNIILPNLHKHAEESQIACCVLMVRFYISVRKGHILEA